MSLSDHDRPLDKRGKRDAPFMGELLAKRGWAPDVLISSTAKRARLTAQEFARALGRSENDIQLMPEIYEASVETILSIIRQSKAEWQSIALFGHNPTFTWVANHFQRGTLLDNVPTCGVVEIEAPDLVSWQDFEPPVAHVTAFHYPKQYFE